MDGRDLVVMKVEIIESGWSGEGLAIGGRGEGVGVEGRDLVVINPEGA